MVTKHRGRFGLEVMIVEPDLGLPAFIDFVLLGDGRDHVAPEDFPAVSTVMDAVALDVMPNGELRLSPLGQGREA
ncbi:hypothetical protein ADL15_19120 [Actinoplanes awajinensis subsp. mycoplanecinus]|uniref:Uncharacterized protein n=1 Tax=Actinoplanes awajinensis subsp. mycoplanecinus TaxID=135947 RepID=A0A101JUF2_9ACTN|nr:hypothetical protein ADL15_19120 [Actinoplanes awajinensis subsp. mycoplanecinus]